ncbi:MAG: rhodanese-like domain-containing protein [Cellulosilyticaceae bacterium]
MIKKIMCVVVISIGALAGCSGEAIDQVNATQEAQAPYRTITPELAKERLDQGLYDVLLDVRTQEEYEKGHIKGSLLIPNTILAQEAEEALPDKEATIIVYCRSGSRSKASAKQLIEMGYSKVYDLGGIQDWPYEVVTGTEDSPTSGSQDKVVIDDAHFVEQMDVLYLDPAKYEGQSIVYEGFVAEVEMGRYGVVRYMDMAHEGHSDEILVGLEAQYDGEWPVDDTWVRIQGTIQSIEENGEKIPMVQIIQLDTDVPRGQEKVTSPY